MKRLSLGGHSVPRIGMGTLYITGQRGFGSALPHAAELLQQAVHLGVQFFDTADSYGNGAAEQAIHDALYPYENLLIATKGGYRHERLGAWVADARPEHLRLALEGSLRRLDIEAIDLYQLHCADRGVPYSESVGALVDMKTEGKIRHIGVSNVGVTQLETACRETEIVSVQNAFNVRHSWCRDVVDYCEYKGIVFIPWMPLGDGSISWDEPEYLRISQKYNATPAQIALAVLLHLSPVILPIPGTSSIRHLQENFNSGEIELDKEDIAAFLAVA